MDIEKSYIQKAKMGTPGAIAIEHIFHFENKIDLNGTPGEAHRVKVLNGDFDLCATYIPDDDAYYFWHIPVGAGGWGGI